MRVLRRFDRPTAHPCPIGIWKILLLAEPAITHEFRQLIVGRTPATTG